jgi:hypothetical protein
VRRAAEETARRYLARTGPGLPAPAWLAAVAQADPLALPFLAGLVKVLALGCALKAQHDKLLAYVERAPRAEDRALLEAWGWEYDEDDECYCSFYPGG